MLSSLNMVKKSSASKSVGKVRDGVTDLLQQIQKVSKKSRERKIKLVAIEKELSENKKECDFLRTKWFSTKEDLRKANESVSTLQKEISDLKSIKTDSNIRLQNNVLTNNVHKRNTKTIQNAISVARRQERDPHKMQQRTKTLLKQSFHKPGMTNWELVLKLWSCPTPSLRKLILKK